MAKKRQRQQEIEFQGYIEVRLDEEGKKEFKRWKASIGDLDDTLMKLCEGGYRLSMSYDDYNGAYMCSMTTKDAQSENAGWVLVGRGNSPVSAMQQVVFKHLVVTSGMWVNFRQSSRNDWDDN